MGEVEGRGRVKERVCACAGEGRWGVCERGRSTAGFGGSSATDAASPPSRHLPSSRRAAGERHTHVERHAGEVGEALASGKFFGCVDALLQTGFHAPLPLSLPKALHHRQPAWTLAGSRRRREGARRSP